MVYYVHMKYVIIAIGLFILLLIVNKFLGGSPI
jgi:hypothetical protein